MKPTTAENLMNLAAELDLAPHEALIGCFRDAGGHDVDAAAFGQVLVRQELLTGFQLERLLRGEPRGYFYGRAKILYQIGAGSFARVYRAINRDTGGMLAVKVLRSRYSADKEKCAWFQREGEMGRLLRHPHIVAIEDVGHEHGTSYITMEFVEGQTLRELARIRGGLDLPRALDMILQVLSGLEYAHRRGVSHRDIKASNVLVSSTGQAKLVDFGLARVDESADRQLGRVAQPRTVDYAALEKLTGMHDDDVRSDIYFMGTLAYLALSGTSALQESRDRNVRSDPRRFTAVEPLATRAPQVPRDVVDVVARMMHLDPLERWQTAADARRAVEQVAAHHAGRDSTAGATKASAAAKSDRPADRGSVMLVESSEKGQQRLREFFTKLGYRVLLTENPQRALVRFSSQPPPADCLVLSAASLGTAAVEAFNTLSTDPSLSAVPAILLADGRQEALLGQAKVDDRRRIVALPLQTEVIRSVLAEVVK